MKLFGVKVSNWIWVLYPVIVIAVVLFGTNYLLSSGEMSFAKLASRQDEIEAQEKLVTELRTKLEQLRKVDRNKSLDDLQELLQAMPPSKRVWLVVGQLRDASAVASLGVDSYSAMVGDVTEASEGAKKDEELYETPLTMSVDFEIGSFEQITKILAMLEVSQPLAKIRTIDYQDNAATVVFDSAWLPWKQITVGDVGNKVPDYQKDVLTAIQKITELDEKKMAVSADTIIVIPVQIEEEQVDTEPVEPIEPIEPIEDVETQIEI